MSFNTNKYTRPVLVNEIKKLNSSAFANVNSLADALSPRVGRKSAKFAALKRAVNLNQMFAGQYKGTVKQFILKSLTN